MKAGILQARPSAFGTEVRHGTLRVVDGGVRIEPEGEGAILGVRAQPGARRRGASGVWNGMLKVGIAAPAEDGRANEELVRTLAEILGVRAADVRLLQGERSRTKRFRIALGPAACAARIERVLAGAD